MISTHPTETAGSGKLQDQSRYINPADLLDQNIECAQCGFIFDLRTHPSGDSYGAVGAPTIKSESVAAPFWMPVGFKTVSYTNTYGDPQPTAGCPLCGTLNPQAKGRGKSGFDRAVKSILGL